MVLTYLDFLVVFVASPLALLVVAGVRRPSRHRPSRRLRAAGTLLLLAVALVYTTPWDNLLIDAGVWWYGDGRVAGRLWHAPVSEYLFIVLQTVLVAVWTVRLAGPVRTDVTHTRWDRVAGVLAGTVVTGVGVAFLAGPGSTDYLGAILAWAGPVLALQWGVGWRYLVAVRRRLALAIAAPVVYLCAIDRVAIQRGLWTISPTHTTGVTVAGLPVEEATFFLCTTTFVVQGLVLLRWVVAGWR